MTIPTQCLLCKRWTGSMKCEAFPEQIPKPILLGEHDHRNPYPGDDGLRYVPIAEDWMDAEDLDQPTDAPGSEGPPEVLGPCSSCGLAFEKLRETGQLGCPHCYTTYESYISRHPRKTPWAINWEIGCRSAPMPKFDIDTLIRDVSAETWERMLVEITLGKKPEANNAKERAVRDRLTRQVGEIQSGGGIVEIPHDWA